MATYAALPTAPGSYTHSIDSSRPHVTPHSLRDLELDSPSHSPPPRPPRHTRSDTLGSLSGFNFGRAGAIGGLEIPLSLSAEESERNAGRERGSGTGGVTDRHVGLIDGIALVVGLQVGSGIFSSPGVVLASVGSPGAALAVWIVSGLLAWSGASSFAELGSAIPLNGGSQAYLAYAYGPLVSYLFSWTAVVLLKPGSAAIIALVGGEYITKLLYHATASSNALASLPAIIIPDWPHKLVGVLAVLIVSLINLLSTRSGTGVQVVLTVVKIGSILLVIVLGLVGFAKGGGGVLSANGLFEGSSRQIGSYAIALYSGLWAFDGWDQSNYVAGEMRSVTRDLPRVIHGSMTIVTFLFLLANTSYFTVLDKAVVASSNTVALDFGTQMLGPAGGISFACLVAISCFGALNGSFYTTAKLICALSRESFIPSFFGRLSSSRKTPDNAMALQATLTILYILFGRGFRTLVNLFSVAQWLFYFLTVLGLLILRIKEPHLERPYQTFLVTPIIFCVVSLFLLLMPIVAAPGEAIAAFAFILFGVPLYYLTASSRPLDQPTTSSGPPSQLSFKDRLSDGWNWIQGLFAHRDEARRGPRGQLIRSGVAGSEIVEMVSQRGSLDERERMREVGRTPVER